MFAVYIACLGRGPAPCTAAAAEAGEAAMLSAKCCIVSCVRGHLRSLPMVKGHTFAECLVTGVMLLH